MDGTRSLYALPAFTARPPRDADVVPYAGYRGEFPVEGDDPSLARLTAGCEYLEGSRRAGAPWLGPDAPQDAFVDLMNAGDLAGAWLALNTPGWRVEQLRSALAQLAAAVDDPALHLLAGDWAERTDPVSGGY